MNALLRVLRGRRAPVLDVLVKLIDVLPDVDDRFRHGGQLLLRAFRRQILYRCRFAQTLYDAHAHEYRQTASKQVTEQAVGQTPSTTKQRPRAQRARGQPRHT